MKQNINEIKKMQRLAGIITEVQANEINDANKQDQFWNIASDTNFEQAIRSFKNAGFTTDDVVGFIQMHWDRM